MKATRIRWLAGVAVAIGAIVYATLHWLYNRLPAVPWYGPGLVLFLAVAEALAAQSVRDRLRRRPGHRPMEPMVVARLAALAKASSLAGAIALGGYAALLGYTLQRLEATTPAHDAGASGFGVFSSLLLIIAALLLERVCRLPKDHDEDAPEPPEEWDPLRDLHRDDRRGR